MESLRPILVYTMKHIGKGKKTKYNWFSNSSDVLVKAPGSLYETEL